MVFNSTVMIASSKLSNGAFNFLGSLTGKSGNNTENVNVIAWECDDKSDIKPLIEKLIKEAEAMEQTETLQANVKAMNGYLDEMNSGVYEHDIPKNLSEAIFEQIRRTFGYGYIQDLRSDTHLMYLSGVDPRTL